MENSTIFFNPSLMVEEILHNNLEEDLFIQYTVSSTPLNKCFYHDYIRVLFWNCRVWYHWIIFIYCPKNWHKHWCCSWTPFRRSADNDHSGPLFSQFLPLNFFLRFFFVFKILFKKYVLSPEFLDKFGGVLPLAGCSKITFSSLLEASFPSG